MTALHACLTWLRLIPAVLAGLSGSLVLAGLLTFALPGNSHAQATGDMPRAEYYVARELFRVGRTLEASDGFALSLNRAQRTGEQRWIDSVPSLVMLGECHYQRGELALALEQYDAALMLLLANPTWVDQLQLSTEPLPAFDAASKGIQWFGKSRPMRAAAVPAGVPLVDSAPSRSGAPVGGVTTSGPTAHLDAPEVLRTTGIALMRRWKALGPLVRHSPLSGPLDALFSRNSSHQAPWFVASWRVLQGLSGLASQAPVDSRQLLRQGALVGNQSDYYLSALALLVLGELEAREGNYAAAIVHYQDASLVAAHFDQHATTAEAIERLAACAAASGHSSAIEPLQRAASWANKKSTALQLSAWLGASELAIYASDFTLADKLLRQCPPLLRNLETALPRVQARFLFVNALSAFGQKRAAQGVASLEQALKIMRGSASSGAAVESIFQTQLVLDLFASQSLSAGDTETLLSELVAEPSAYDWALAPLETIAELTTARDPAYTQLLDLTVDRQGPMEQILAGMDQLQRQRLFVALPLGGREFTWRSLVARPADQLLPSIREVVTAARRRMPTLGSDAQRMGELIGQLRKAPLPLEERKLNTDAKKAFVELEELSEGYESQLAFLSLQRQPLERSVPPAAKLAQLQDRLTAGDLLLGLTVAGRQVIGVAITQETAEYWQVADGTQIDTGLLSLLANIGATRDSRPGSVADATSAAAAWHISAQQLSDALFPATVQEMLANCQRAIVVPHDRLWYVPFELLPVKTDVGVLPWIANHAVTYIPTLGSIEMAFAEPIPVAETVGIVGSFFALEASANQALAQSVGQGIPNSHTLVLAQKNSVPSVAWLKLKTDQLWVATTVESTDNGWDTRVLPLGTVDQTRVGSWLAMPHTSPARVLLPGMRTAIRSGELARGDELFLPICAMLFSGTQHASLSRWPAGGVSTSTLLRRQLEELQSEPPSAALRRAVLALWADQFVATSEPTLLPWNKDATVLVSGDHPLLWAGYMAVGDYSKKSQ